MSFVSGGRDILFVTKNGPEISCFRLNTPNCLFLLFEIFEAVLQINVQSLSKIIEIF